MDKENESEEKRMQDALVLIRDIALNDDHMMVPFSRDNQVMANRVIEKVQKKLLKIADVAQVGLGD